MVTRKHVAVMAGVSVATVSNVFLGKPYLRRMRKRSGRRQNGSTTCPTIRRGACRWGGAITSASCCTSAPIPTIWRSCAASEEYAINKNYMVTVFLLENALSKNFELVKSWHLDALITCRPAPFRQN